MVSEYHVGGWVIDLRGHHGTLWQKWFTNSGRFWMTSVLKGELAVGDSISFPFKEIR